MKQRPDGTVKRRVVIDLRRSGGNALAECPERIILPRIQDVTAMARDLAKRAEAVEDSDPRRSEIDDMYRPNAEFVCFDFKDAFCHFGLCEEELRHALAPSILPDQFLLFRAMLFGYRSAPLIMGRLSAAAARLVQAILEDWQAQIQLYIDDLLMLVRANDWERASCVAVVAYTLKAFGIQLALDKGERGTQIQWIGVTLLLGWERGGPPRSISYGITKKMVLEVTSTLADWENKGMIALKQLRSTTGKLSWIAGVVPRIRWAVSVFYAVVAVAEREESEGVEAQRATKREDTREKKGLVAVKRLGIARTWLLKIFEKPESMLVKAEALQEPQAEFNITDACPTGLGGLIALIEWDRGNLAILEAFEASVSKAEAELLGFEFGASSSQAVVEALAIWKAIKLWSTRIHGKAIIIRSDSSVALAMVDKLSSSSGTLNYLGGELGILAETLEITKIIPQHLAGKLNVEADWLSRLNDNRPAERPATLKGVKLRRLGPAKEVDFSLPPPGSKENPWSHLPQTSASVFRSL